MDIVKTKTHQASDGKHKRHPHCQRQSVCVTASSYIPDFEIYLQWDSFKPEVLQTLRVQDLTDVRIKASANLNEYNVSTTLVVMLQKGLNDDEIGKIIDFALLQPCIRGVTFQPTLIAGRLENFDASKDRITLTDVRQKIL